MSGGQQRSFKADPALWDAVVRAAARAEVTPAEWVREAIRQRLRPGAPRAAVVPTPGGGPKTGRAYPKDVQTANTPKGSGGVRR